MQISRRFFSSTLLVAISAIGCASTTFASPGTAWGQSPGPAVGATQQAPPRALLRLPRANQGFNNHGTWTRGGPAASYSSNGPGTYTITVCVHSTCTINGSPGQSVPVEIEAWGAGGAGGAGGYSTTGPNGHGGAGGGGGGGGGYSKRSINVIIPSSGELTYSVVVGHGGEYSGSHDGGFSQILANDQNGPSVLMAPGGIGGSAGDISPFNTGIGGKSGGFGSQANPNNWSGLPGGNGAVVTTCNGGGGGLGGPGGGPGRTAPGYINDGGDGGHGGYFRYLALPTCLAKSNNEGQGIGNPGGNGRVSFVW